MCATNHCDCPAEELRLPKDVLGEPLQSTKPFSGHPSHIPKCLFSANAIAEQDSVIQKGMRKFHAAIRQIVSHPKIRTILATSQPVHALAIISVGIVFTCLTGEQSTTPKPYSALTTFAYVVAFGLRLGSQYWMTFVSGLSLYFTLQRHAFGDVQVVLFPRYFTSNAILSAISLFAFTKLHSHIPWETTHWIQVITMSTSFLLESLSRLYLAPKVVDLIEKKKAIEVTQPGVGKEVGKHDPGVLKNCPHYMSLHGQFRRKHMFMGVVNVTTIACTIVQLCYVCQSLCFTPC
uniref:Transmembrane protein 205 n=1 Tax=Lygus hesperus TaxID=30085 RepID=A0A146LZ59_LYGHE